MIFIYPFVSIMLWVGKYLVFGFSNQIFFKLLKIKTFRCDDTIIFSLQFKEMLIVKLKIKNLPKLKGFNIIFSNYNDKILIFRFNKEKKYFYCHENIIFQ